MTVDVGFLDEASQVSAEQLSILKIILRKLRKSELPFGGVLILGSMDHTQTHPVNATPFLLSSLILTTFTMVQLKESVRAARDAQFCEFQSLTRENPHVLMGDPDKKTRFFQLMDIFEYANDWNSQKIKPHMARMFARKQKVKSATALYTDSLIVQLESDPCSPPYHVSQAVDHQVRHGTAGDYTRASAATTASLNINLREPEQLVLFPWCVYECTTNDPNFQYSQSNLALLVDMPPQDVLDSFGRFPVWIAPANIQFVNFLEDGSKFPNKDQLRRWN